MGCQQSNTSTTPPPKGRRLRSNNDTSFSPPGSRPGSACSVSSRCSNRSIDRGTKQSSCSVRRLCWKAPSNGRQRSEPKVGFGLAVVPDQPSQPNPLDFSPRRRQAWLDSVVPPTDDCDRPTSSGLNSLDSGDDGSISHSCQSSPKGRSTKQHNDISVDDYVQRSKALEGQERSFHRGRPSPIIT